MKNSWLIRGNSCYKENTNAHELITNWTKIKVCCMVFSCLIRVKEEPSQLFLR